MKYRLMILVVMCWAFTGCGGGGETSKPDNAEDDKQEEPSGIPADSPLLGTWKSDSSLGYYTFKENVFSYAFVDNSYQCLAHTRIFNIQQANERSFTAVEQGSTEATLFQFEFEGDTLHFSTIDEVKYASDFQRVLVDIDSFSDCRDESDTGAVIADLDFIELPESIRLDHTITNFGELEYSVDVAFDMNKSGEVDEGDVILASRHIKTSMLDEPSTVPLEDVGADLWGIQSGWFVSLVPAVIEISENHMRLRLNKAAHPALRMIDNSTQVNIAVSYTDLFGSTNADYYPGYLTYTEGVDTSLLEDPTGDVTDDNSGKFDLYQISISVEN